MIPPPEVLVVLTRGESGPVNANVEESDPEVDCLAIRLCDCVGHMYGMLPIRIRGLSGEGEVTSSMGMVCRLSRSSWRSFSESIWLRRLSA